MKEGTLYTFWVPSSPKGSGFYTQHHHCWLKVRCRRLWSLRKIPHGNLHPLTRTFKLLEERTTLEAQWQLLGQELLLHWPDRWCALNLIKIMHGLHSASLEWVKGSHYFILYKTRWHYSIKQGGTFVCSLEMSHSVWAISSAASHSKLHSSQSRRPWHLPSCNLGRKRRNRRRAAASTLTSFCLSLLKPAFSPPKPPGTKISTLQGTKMKVQKNSSKRARKKFLSCSSFNFEYCNIFGWLQTLGSNLQILPVPVQPFPGLSLFDFLIPSTVVSTPHDLY